MSETDGFEAARRIRSLEPPEHRTPIVALTANARQGDRERCLDAGMDDHLAKPVQKLELEGALTRWVRSRPSPAL